VSAFVLKIAAAGGRGLREEIVRDDLRRDDEGAGRQQAVQKRSAAQGDVFNRHS
jgi:hypothetical protein